MNQEIRAKIIAHFNKTGRMPNYASVGGYEASEPTFEAMVQSGEIIQITRKSPKGRNMKILVLADGVA